MVLGFLSVIFDNGQFDSAFARSLKDRQVLQSRLDTIHVGGRFDKLLLSVFDLPADYFKGNLRGRPPGMYEVTVGYDSSASYPREKDEHVIQLIGGWLRYVFRTAEGYAAKREELLAIVDQWEEEAVRRIVDERERPPR